MTSLLKGKSTAELERMRLLLARTNAIKSSRDNLLDFIRLTMPCSEAPDDASQSFYEITPQSRLLAAIVERVEAFVAGKKPKKNKEFDEFLESRGWPIDRPLNRVGVSIGPQFGKTQLLSKHFLAWFSARNPTKSCITGQYNAPLAEETGGEVRAILRHPNFKHVFPNYELRTGSESKSLLVTAEGGKLAFVGVGGGATGRPADLFIIDDPIKDENEAASATYQERTFNWFTKVSFARLRNKSAIIVVHTRWNQNDVLGRLCDPEHPDHDPKISDKWLYINIPAVVTDPAMAKVLGLKLETPTDPDIIEQFGDLPMAALSPTRKGLPLLAEAKRLDPQGYQALYDGKPNPDKGSYFQAETLIEYEPLELPDRLRIYAGSDHALGEENKHDESVLGCVGIDEFKNIWLLPDIFVGRREPDKLIEEMIHQMQLHKPDLWWAESENILKSIGPFLKTRMIEESTYTVLDPITPTKDLVRRCRSFQGMCALGKVRFPKHAPWWPRMKQQMLMFPNGTRDDFVSFCALIGLGLMKELPAGGVRLEKAPPRVGSLEWVKFAAKAEQRRVLERSGW